MFGYGGKLFGRPGIECLMMVDGVEFFYHSGIENLVKGGGE